MAEENLTVAIDFDGVIHQYSKGWHDGTIYDPPTQGAAAWVDMLKDKGCKVVIFSTRAESKWVNGEWQEGQKDTMAQWLAYHGIPFDEIASGKPMAHAYIDDRAIRFEDWEGAMMQFFDLFDLGEFPAMQSGGLSDWDSNEGNMVDVANKNNESEFVGSYDELNEAVKDLLCELRIDSEDLKLMAEGYSPDYPGVKRFNERKVSPKIQISSVTAEKLYQTIKAE